MLINASGQSSSEANRNALLARHYLRKVATRNAEDLRARYEAGEIGLAELREAAADPPANSIPSAEQPVNHQDTNLGSRKGKSRADASRSEHRVATRYSGVSPFPPNIV